MEKINIENDEKPSEWKWKSVRDCIENRKLLVNYFSRANLFIFSCVAACFSLIAYLGAFSCEFSWILESHGNLPTPSYLLCTGFFCLFVTSTILIHGLATGLPWGLFCWSIIIGIFSIPELCLVMYMTTQYWGLQSTHGLTELISYLLRLIITCLSLLCVIPTAIRWRREHQVHNQLQSLATRLQLGTPVSNPIVTNGTDSISRGSRKKRNRRASGFDNQAFIGHENPVQMVPYGYNELGSQNEFNASIFGLNPSHYIGPADQQQRVSKRTQSLLDLRYIMPGPFTSKSKASKDEIDHTPLNNEVQFTNKNNNSVSEEIINDPIYYEIEPYKNTKLGRNCVSLENLSGGVNAIKNDLTCYGNNLLQNYNPQWVQQPAYQQFPPQYFNYQQHHQGFGYSYNNPYICRSNNSKQSLGNESDDYRKYRDVAL